MKLYFLSILFLFLLNNISGQDSLTFKSSFDIELKGKHILLPSSNDRSCFSCNNRTLTDNPFYHFAIYNGINHTLVINDKYTLLTGLYLEERSFSGGNNTLSNLVIFPKIRIGSKDTIKINEKLYKISIDGGDFWNEDLSDMLRIYNLDYQAVRLEASQRNHSFSFLVVADLSMNVGLNLHELYRLSYRYDHIKWQNSFFVDYNQFFLNNKSTADFNVGDNLRYKISNHLQSETQFEIRINDEVGFGKAFGSKLTWIKNNFKGKFALRYYDKNYNFGYVSNKPQFRSGDKYIGEQLYALKNYFRNYNQWAFYTQFQNQDVAGIELGISNTMPLYKKLSYFYDIDINYLAGLDFNDQKLIPLYNLGFKIHFIKALVSEFSITNKHMNLDSNAQTFYASKKPYISYMVSLDLQGISKKK